MTTENNAMVTGSRAYGVPTEKSDLDVVVKMSCDDAMILLALSEAQDVTRYRDGQLTLRFGKLNLIVCYENNERFNNWVKGTTELKTTKPNSREHAIYVFEELFSQEQND